MQWSMAELAALLGWSVERTLDTLRATDERRAKAGKPPVLVRLGRLWFVTRGGLQQIYPHDWMTFIARLDEIANRRAGKP